MCVTFDGYAKAKFFDGLISEEVKGKVRFRKGSEEPTVFPQDMEIETEASGAPCTSAAASGMPTAAPQFLDSVSFLAQWIDGSSQSPATLLPLNNDQRPWNELNPRRTFRFRLASKNVRLTEQLTILVRLDDKTIATLAGAVSVTLVRALMSQRQIVYRLAY